MGFNEAALRKSYVNTGRDESGGSSMWKEFTKDKQLGSGERTKHMKSYKKLLAELDNERRSRSSKPQPKPAPAPKPTPKPTPRPTPTPTPRPIEKKVKLIPGLEERISTPAPKGTDKITLLVGKNGDMKTTIGDDNEIVRSDIGNDNSETELRLKVSPTVFPATDEEIATRSEAKEKAQNWLDLFGSFGKTGDMTTSIGNRNIITDSSIGNDNSKTYGSFDYGTGMNFS